jgi:hypothetical protein
MSWGDKNCRYCTKKPEYGSGGYYTWTDHDKSYTACCKDCIRKNACHGCFDPLPEKKRHTCSFETVGCDNDSCDGVADFHCCGQYRSWDDTDDTSSIECAGEKKDAIDFTHDCKCEGACADNYDCECEGACEDNYDCKGVSEDDDESCHNDDCTLCKECNEIYSNPVSCRFGSVITSTSKKDKLRQKKQYRIALVEAERIRVAEEQRAHYALAEAERRRVAEEKRARHALAEADRLCAEMGVVVTEGVQKLTEIFELGGDVEGNLKTFLTELLANYTKD